MKNVIDFSAFSTHQTRDQRLCALIRTVAGDRRGGDDVFWLKENAELLNILECTGTGLPPQALAPYEPFYRNAPEKLRFFPQYYRFLLSIALDLEALGMGGDQAARMVAMARDAGWAGDELSDLQRAEARRLMARRGVDPLPRDAGLEDRVRRFAERAAGFALPNRKTAYELTHTVFYLSEYGRRDPGLGAGARRSLIFAGLVAFLDANADLLAEICVALRQAGHRPPEAWEGWLTRIRAGFRTALLGVRGGQQDDYHEFLVCAWHGAATGAPLVTLDIPEGPVAFQRPGLPQGSLRPLSQALYAMADARHGDWHRMRPKLEAELPQEVLDHLAAAAESTPEFAEFFALFARADAPGVAA